MPVNLLISKAMKDVGESIDASGQEHWLFHPGKGYSIYALTRYLVDQHYSRNNHHVAAMILKNDAIRNKITSNLKTLNSKYIVFNYYIKENTENIQIQSEDEFWNGNEIPTHREEIFNVQTTIKRDGKYNIYFIYVYTEKETDKAMKSEEIIHIQDDIQEIKRNGLLVTIIEHGKEIDLINAFYDPFAILIVISGHGYFPGYDYDPDKLVGIQTADGGIFTPNDIFFPESLSKNLKTVIFENCFQKDNQRVWESKIPNVEIVAWMNETSVQETNRFNESGTNTRQKKKLSDHVQEAIAYRKSPSYTRYN